MTNRQGRAFPDSDIRDRVRALRELETRAATDLQRAYDAIDQTIDLRQQGRFRIFEQQIEQRKLQLLMRARQANRQNRACQRQSVLRKRAGALEWGIGLSLEPRAVSLFSKKPVFHESRT